MDVPPTRPPATLDYAGRSEPGEGNPAARALLWATLLTSAAVAGTAAVWFAVRLGAYSPPRGYSGGWGVVLLLLDESTHRLLGFGPLAVVAGACLFGRPWGRALPTAAFAAVALTALSPAVLVGFRLYQVGTAFRADDWYLLLNRHAAWLSLCILPAVVGYFARDPVLRRQMNGQ